MAVITLRISNDEKRILQEAAKLNNRNMSAFIKDIIFDHLEDEYDLAVAKEAYAEYLANPLSYSLTEVREELGLDE